MSENAKKVLLFFGTFFSNVPKFQQPLSSRGEGGLYPNGPAIFFAASLREHVKK